MEKKKERQQNKTCEAAASNNGIKQSNKTHTEDIDDLIFRDEHIKLHSEK